MKYLKYLKFYAPDENGSAESTKPAADPTPEEMTAEINRMRQEKEEYERAEAERIRAEYAALKAWKDSIVTGAASGSHTYSAPAQNPLDGRTDNDRRLDDRYSNGAAKMFYGDTPTHEQIKACRLMAGLAAEE